MSGKSGPHPLNQLTVVQVRQLSSPGKYADGNGLYLVVDPGGGKRWILRTVIRGKRRDMGLGGVSVVSLADARELAAKYRRIAREGGDPFAHRIAERQTAPTFEEAAIEVHSHRKDGWRNSKHADQWINTLRQYAFPTLGKLTVDRIDTPDVLKVLSSIWLSKPETARRLRQRIAAVMDWAKAAGHRMGDNPVDGVAKGLPKQSKHKDHHAAMPFADVPGFVARLRVSASDLSVTSRLALELLILTALRTSEVLNAKWSEFDLKAKLWTVPKDRMKAGREHRVPLGERALQVLAEVRPFVGGSDYVFPGMKEGKPLSNMALLQLLKRMQVGTTVHGFRSSFRDWAAETTHFPREVAEMALAHTIDNEVEGAYRRGDLLEKRRQLMDSWADYLAPQQEQSKSALGSAKLPRNKVRARS